MLDTVDAVKGGGIDFVAGGGNADAVGEIHDAALLQVGHPDIGLEHVEAQDAAALQLHVELGVGGNGHAHLVIDALPFHQMAGVEDARRNADAGVGGLAVFHRLIRKAARTAHRGHAPGQERAALLLAGIALAVGMEIDQPRHGGELRRLDGGAAGFVRLDGGDAVAADDDVHVVAGGLGNAVHQLADMHHILALGHILAVGESSSGTVLRPRRSRCPAAAACHSTDRECDGCRRPSSGHRRSRWSGGAAAPAARRWAPPETPSECLHRSPAMRVPSGDQTGPFQSRASMERPGTGAYHLSSLASGVPVDDMVSTWLVPSR